MVGVLLWRVSICDQICICPSYRDTDFIVGFTRSETPQMPAKCQLALAITGAREWHHEQGTDSLQTTPRVNERLVTARTRSQCCGFEAFITGGLRVYWEPNAAEMHSCRTIRADEIYEGWDPVGVVRGGILGLINSCVRGESRLYYQFKIIDRASCVQHSTCRSNISLLGVTGLTIH